MRFTVRLPLIVLAVLVFSMTACTRQVPLSRLEPGRRVEVELISGATIEAVVVSAQPELVLEEDNGMIVKPHRIVRVVDVRHGRGAIVGTFAGMFTGFALGVSLAYVQEDDPSCKSCGALSKDDHARIGGVLLGGFGAMTGALAGAIAGTRDIYEVQRSSEMRITPEGPKGSVAGLTVRF
jgi:hypothetical protein